MATKPKGTEKRKAGEARELIDAGTDKRYVRRDESGKFVEGKSIGEAGRTKGGRPSAPHAYGPPVVVEVMVKVRALAFAEPEGGYSVVVPEIPGCVTQGESIEDVEAMVAELAGALLEMTHEEAREAAIREMSGPLPSEAGA